MSGELLFLCHRIPYPPDRGDKIRSFRIMARLAGIAPVHIGCFADDDADMAHAAALAPYARSRCVIRRDRSRILAGLRGLARRQPLSLALFDDPRLRAWVMRMLAERPISAIVVYSGQMAQYVPPLAPNIRFIMDFVDVDSAKFAAYGAGQRGPMGWINRREGQLLGACEKAVAARADISLFVSEAEAALFRRATGLGADRVRAMRNGVDTGYFDPAAAFSRLTREERGEGPLIVFTGQMDYRPNVEAVERFAMQGLPLLRARHPAARFAIVGRNPAPQVRALARMAGVIVTGAVPDVRGWIAAADAVVAPLRIARGVQNKLLEAMAMARPVVASPHAAEGIDAVDGEHLLIAPDPAAEAAMLAGLLADPAGAERMGAAARAHMAARYDWAAALADLPRIVSGEGAAPGMRGQAA